MGGLVETLVAESRPAAKRADRQIKALAPPWEGGGRRRER